VTTFFINTDKNLWFKLIFPLLLTKLNKNYNGINVILNARSVRTNSQKLNINSWREDCIVM